MEIEPPAELDRRETSGSDGGSSRRGAVVLVASQSCQLATQVLGIIVLSRLLSPSAFGLVGMVTALVGLASVIGEFGLSLSALTGNALSLSQRNNLFWLNACVGLLLMLLVMASAPAVSAFYGRPQLVDLTLVLSVPYFVNATAVQFKLELNLRRRWTRLAATEAVPAAVALMGAVAIAAATGSYWSLAIQPIIASVLQLVLAVTWSSWRPGRPDRRGDIRDHLRFGRDTAGLQAFNYLASNADSVLIGHSLGQAALGQYNRAYTLAVLPQNQLAAPLTRVVLTQLARTPRERLNSELRRYQGALVYAQLAPISFVAATAYPLMRLLLGPRWPDVPHLLQIESLGAAFSALGYVFYWTFLVQRRTRLMAVTEGACEVAMVIAMALVVSRGSTWIAWCVVGGQLAMMTASGAVSQRFLEVDLVGVARASMRPTAIFAVAAAAGIGAYNLAPSSEEILSFVTTAGAWGLVCGACVCTSRVVREDLRVFLSALWPGRPSRSS
ncbi:MAG: lipopolysaccharide biosynthesis protein [Solirubrobacteraceae bacterium]|jgi:PST family polysaccharide transporter